MDRNAFGLSYFYIIKSLSARRAWIEIPDGSSGRQEKKQVALRKESVDRNGRS